MNKCCNYVSLKGKISNPTLLAKNEFYWNTYSATIEIKRNSGTIDTIPIRFSEKLLIPFIKQDSFVEIKGFLQSRTENSKLYVFVFATEIGPLGKEEYENDINLAGFVCQKKELRQTPLSNKNIVDFCVAINIASRSFYIPTIAWNAQAYKVSFLDQGSFVSLSGRIQSREYLKKYDDGSEEMKTTYELSVFKVN